LRNSDNLVWTVGPWLVLAGLEAEPDAGPRLGLLASLAFEVEVEVEVEAEGVAFLCPRNKIDSCISSIDVTGIG
jgi:hypothetical protein